MVQVGSKVYYNSNNDKMMAKISTTIVLIEKFLMQRLIVPQMMSAGDN